MRPTVKPMSNGSVITEPSEGFNKGKSSFATAEINRPRGD